MVLYALGSNGSGQLGVGHTEDCAVPTRHEVDFHNVLRQPLKVVGGGNHTLILTRSGELFASGDLAAHLHRNLLREKTRSLQTMLLAANVNLCSATWEASVVAYADSDDRLCSYGNGSRAELGRDALQSQDALTLPHILSTGEVGISRHIIDVASSVQHTVLILADGQVLGWGSGRKGQLGEPVGIIEQPRVVKGIPFKPRRVVCGREFTYLIGDEADGRHLILGSDKWGARSQAPAAVPGWLDIDASWGSIFVLLRSGKVISWGRNDHGQLAPAGLPAISKLACGSEHCVALTRQGQVLAWGWGEHGNCGSRTDSDGDTKPGWNQIKLPDGNEDIVGVGAGCATSWLWTLAET